MKFEKVDLFSPYIMVVIIALYVALAAIAYQEHLRNLQWISSTTFLYVLMGTLFFIAGVFLLKSFTIIMKNSNLCSVAMLPRKIQHHGMINSDYCWMKEFYWPLS